MSINNRLLTRSLRPEASPFRNFSDSSPKLRAMKVQSCHQGMPAARIWGHLLHRPPGEKDQVYVPADQAAFSQHSKDFLREFDQHSEKAATTSARLGGGLALLGGLGAATGVALGGISVLEGFILTAIAGVTAAIVTPGLQVELSRRSQTKFLETTPTPYLTVAHGWLAADFTVVPPTSNSQIGSAGGA